MIKSQTSPYPLTPTAGGDKEPEKEVQRPTACTVFALCTVLFLLIVLIVALGEFGFQDESAFLYHSHRSKPERRELEQPCDTHECIHYSSELIDIIDSSVKPCDDFYSHVCARFDGGKQRSERLQKLIDTSTEPEHPKAARVVRRMLSVCAIEKHSMIDGWKRIIADMPFPLLTPSENRDLNSSSLLTSLLVNLTKYTPEDVGILGVQPSQDSEFSLYIVKPNGTPPSANEIRGIFDLLKASDVVWNATNVQEQLDDVVRFQNALAGLEFQSHKTLVDLSGMQSKMPIIDWKSLCDSWQEHDETWNFAGKVFGFNVSYYEQLTALIASYRRETVFNFLLIRFSFVFLRPELERDRHESCLLQISTTIPGQIVMHGSAEPESEQLLVKVLSSIQEHLELSVKTLEWMESPDAMKEAQRKFQAVKFHAGFRGEDAIDEIYGKEHFFMLESSKFQLKTINRNADYLSMLSEVARWQSRNMFKSIAENEETLFLNADVFYSVENNSLTISRALLHYPFISSKLPLYVNFATVSALVLPQMIHVFDERGRFYDSYGRHRDWWIGGNGNGENTTAMLFRRVLKCFEEKDQNFLGVSVTVGLNAYNSTEDPYQTLPGQRDRKDITLFFYSFAKTMCNWEAEEVNEALKNVPQFNVFFGCAKTSGMYSDRQCKLAS